MHLAICITGAQACCIHHIKHTLMDRWGHCALFLGPPHRQTSEAALWWLEMKNLWIDISKPSLFYLGQHIIMAAVGQSLLCQMQQFLNPPYLGMECMAGIWSPPQLLGTHPVTFH